VTLELTNLRTEAEKVAASRSRLYQLLGIGFGFPDREFFGALRDGSFAAAVEEARGVLPYRSPAPLPPRDSEGDDYQEFETEYIRLFDVGAAGPPCPLYGGVYAGDRMKTMEDAVRFYNFFDLHMSPEMRELPDHITTELEFLHYLTFREAQALQEGLDPSPLLRAERDFLARHLRKWVPRLQARLAKQETLAFFPAWVEFAGGFFDSDGAYAEAAAEAADASSSD